MLKKLLYTIIVIVCLLGFWQVGEDLANRGRSLRNETSFEAFIPTPLTIEKTFVSNGDQLIREAGYTLGRALSGFAIGAVLAILISLIFLFFPFFRNVFSPLAFAMNSFPIIGLAPAIIIAFGQGSWLSIVFISMLICYFPILISLDTAYKHIDNEIIEIMQVFHASRLQIFFKVQLPLVLPYLFMSMKLAIPASIIGATMGEWLGSRTGLGQLITIALYQLKPGLLYAALFLIVGVSLLAILIFSFLEHLLFPWNRKITK